jgi:4-amino-4-deoxy-L-arabinose transferase-like glycosyltransferase
MKLPLHSRWLVAACALVVISFAFRLGGYPLLEPDEGRNAEVAREMAASNNYAVPHLNQLPYVDKPVLFFAVGAAVMEVLGPTELAARLPSLLFTLATLGAVWWFGRRHVGQAGGLVAAAATGAMPLTSAFARTVIFDSALTFFVTISIVAFYQAAEAPKHPPAPGWTTLGWTGLALGILTKGPVALALPLMVILPYLGWRRRLDVIWDAVAVTLFVAILLPWLFAMSRAVPNFLEYVLVTETFKRLTTGELQRTAPFWYFLPIIFAGSLPWSLAIVSGWRRGAMQRDASGAWDRRVVLLLLWIVVPLLFFSISQSKRPHYVLPLMPAIGLLTALLWSEHERHPPGARGAGAGLAVLGVVFFFAPRIVTALLELEPVVAQAIPRVAQALGLVCLLTGLAVLFGLRRRNTVVFTLCVPVAAIPLVGVTLMRAVGQDRSSRAVAQAIQQAASDGVQVVAVETYPLSLPFYLRRPLVVATGDGAELTSNYLTRSYAHWARVPGSPLRPRDWWMEALADCRRPRVFVVREDDTATRGLLAERLPLIASNRKVAAYGPCGAVDLADARMRRTPRSY